MMVVLMKRCKAFGAVTMALLLYVLRTPPTPAKAGLPWKEKIRQLDLLGATLLLGVITCLNLALQWGGIVYPWSSPNVFGCLIGFGLLLLVFLYLQRRGKERFVPPPVIVKPPLWTYLD